MTKKKSLRSITKFQSKKQTNKNKEGKRRDQKKSLRSITKFHSDDIDYNITRINYELVIGWLVGHS